MRFSRPIVVASLALLAGLMTGAYIEPMPIQPCETKESRGLCRWEAPERGDGTGRSFTVYPDGSVLYDDQLIPA